MRHKGQILTTFAVSIFLVSLSTASGQVVGQQVVPTESQQRRALEDPVRQLNLSPEQREKIRSIREQSKAERAAINERLRETNRALEEALDADNPNEGIIEERVRDVAQAQAAAMRIRILIEVRIRRELTLGQLAILRTLRQQTGQFGRERSRVERQQQRQQGIEQSPLQIPPDRIGPLLRQRGWQRRSRP